MPSKMRTGSQTGRGSKKNENWCCNVLVAHSQYVTFWEMSFPIVVNEFMLDRERAMEIGFHIGRDEGGTAC